MSLPVEISLQDALKRVQRVIAFPSDSAICQDSFTTLPFAFDDERKPSGAENERRTSLKWEDSISIEGPSTPDADEKPEQISKRWSAKLSRRTPRQTPTSQRSGRQTQRSRRSGRQTQTSRRSGRQTQTSRRSGRQTQTSRRSVTSRRLTKQAHLAATITGGPERIKSRAMEKARKPNDVAAGFYERHLANKMVDSYSPQRTLRIAENGISVVNPAFCIENPVRMIYRERFGKSGAKVSIQEFSSVEGKTKVARSRVSRVSTAKQHFRAGSSHCEVYWNRLGKTQLGPTMSSVIRVMEGQGQYANTRQVYYNAILVGRLAAVHVQELVGTNYKKNQHVFRHAVRIILNSSGKPVGTIACHSLNPASQKAVIELADRDRTVILEPFGSGQWALILNGTQIACISNKSSIWKKAVPNSFEIWVEPYVDHAFVLLVVLFIEACVH